MDTISIKLRSKLTSLWMLYFLSHVYRSFHELANHEFVENMIAGTINGRPVTELMLVVGWLMIAPQLLLIPLTQFLNDKACRAANLFIGIFALVMTLLVYSNPDLDDLFFAAMELSAVVLVIKVAWSWRV